MVWFNDTNDRAWRALQGLSRAHSPFSERAGTRESWPPVDVWVGDDGALVRAWLPAVEADAIEVKVLENVVILTCARPGDDGAASRSAREIRLPFRADAGGSEASLKRGVFELRVPRHVSQQPSRIEVKSE